MDFAAVPFGLFFHDFGPILDFFEEIGLEMVQTWMEEMEESWKLAFLNMHLTMLLMKCKA